MGLFSVKKDYQIKAHRKCPQENITLYINCREMNIKCGKYLGNRAKRIFFFKDSMWKMNNIVSLSLLQTDEFVKVSL